MKKKIWFTFLSLSMVFSFFMINQESQSVEFTHDKARNEWCNMLGNIEGCVEHEWRSCTHLNFCSGGDPVIE